MSGGRKLSLLLKTKAPRTWGALFLGDGFYWTVKLTVLLVAVCVLDARFEPELNAACATSE
jgi:hypothetical protein